MVRMGDNTTFRKNDEDVRIMKMIRKYLTDTIGEASDTDCIRYAFRAAERELKAENQRAKSGKQ
jgi:hypothetical protein